MRKSEDKKIREYLVLNYSGDVRRNIGSPIEIPHDHFQTSYLDDKDIMNERKDGKQNLFADDNVDEGEDEWEWETDEEYDDQEENDGEQNTNSNNNNETKLSSLDKHSFDQTETKALKNTNSVASVKSKPDISIDGSILQIKRARSLDESDEEDSESKEKCPFAPPAPPLPPSYPNVDKKEKKSNKNRLVTSTWKKTDKIPDWNEMMQEIEKFYSNHKLRKTECNDRSGPFLPPKTNKGKRSKEKNDILNEIKVGTKLKHVKTNDRSKPNVNSIACFRHQISLEDRHNGHQEPSLNLAYAGNKLENGYHENVNELKDDLESTKQLLELEVRSKKLLERDNKKLQLEIDKMRKQFAKYEASNQDKPVTPNCDDTLASPEIIKHMRNSSLIADKRQSIILLVGESATPNDLTIKEAADEAKKEAEEAKDIALQWEIKYRELNQKINDNMLPSNFNDEETNNAGLSLVKSDYSKCVPADLETQSHILITKLRNIAEKKELVLREHSLLMDRIQELKESICSEVEARNRLKNEVAEMNRAFENEMESNNNNDLDDVYYSDEDNLVTNTHKNYFREKKDSLVSQGSSGSETCAKISSKRESFCDATSQAASEDMASIEDVAELTIDQILQMAENEDESTDSGQNHFKECPDTPPEETQLPLHEKVMQMNLRLDMKSENLQQMKRTNLQLKSKINKLVDILKMQRMKHQDLKQELSIMLADIM